MLTFARDGYRLVRGFGLRPIPDPFIWAKIVDFWALFFDLVPATYAL